MKRIQQVDKSLEIKELYNLWSKDYDSCDNRTRDLDHHCLKDKEFKIPAYEHQLDEYLSTAKHNGYKLEQIKHQNDLDGKQNTARLIILIFRKIRRASV